MLQAVPAAAVTLPSIELETNGNNGSNSGWPASVYGGYGTKDINGYGKLQYVRMKQ